YFRPPPSMYPGSPPQPPSPIYHGSSPQQPQYYLPPPSIYPGSLPQQPQFSRPPPSISNQPISFRSSSQQSQSQHSQQWPIPPPLYYPPKPQPGQPPPYYPPQRQMPGYPPPPGPYNPIPHSYLRNIRNSDEDKAIQRVRKSVAYQKTSQNKKLSGQFSRWDGGNSDCNCDRDFYQCLRNVNNVISRKVGSIYFNILHRQCMAFDHPIVRCVKRQGLLQWRCIQYDLDTTKPMELQWRDNPYFYLLL
ncbi:hypothetical protein PV325_009795, partial [Microctonus aethiopoides]